jgi:hypothetical protein
LNQVLFDHEIEPAFQRCRFEMAVVRLMV